MKCNLCKCDLTKHEIIDEGLGDTYYFEINFDSPTYAETYGLCEKCWEEFAWVKTSIIKKVMEEK